jgi:phosphate transport system permease protein
VRRLKDRLATATITTGGSGVLMAILLIFFYLLYEIVPLFSGATLEKGRSVSVAAQALSSTRYLAVEEQGRIALAVTGSGSLNFIDLVNGSFKAHDLRDEHGLAPTLVVEESPQSRLLALGYRDGDVLLAKHNYRLTYPNDELLVTAELEFPYGQDRFALPGSMQQLAVRDGDNALVLVGHMASGEFVIRRFNKEENFLSGEVSLEEEELHIPASTGEIAGLYVGVDQNWLYQLHRDGSYIVWNFRKVDSQGFLAKADSGQLGQGASITAVSMLLGGISLLVATDDGELAQYFMVREDGVARLERIRDFDAGSVPIVKLLPEHRRKGFIGVNAEGELRVFHSTSRRTLLVQQLQTRPIESIAINPRAKAIYLIDTAAEAIRTWKLDNEHPEISWAALWSKVWYESYPEPDYTWQSSASNNDFEPKYSFAPLAFGTLKAAFYAMLIAAPMAIFGAIYTAYFMAPALRRKVKPLIELMEALPTVILGFLAGLWLAPFVETNLTGVFSVLLLMPPGILLFAWLWSRLPVGLQARVPAGWQALVLIPVVCLIGYACFAMNDRVELLLFSGDMRMWITNEIGISFDQRNALVVGIAMGMAVIPTIFSIAEDAIFSVPRHLSYGSLALGATPWQTLVGVVLPTASPGIFSGLMIGMGRAVGETMIVLMATGNTPIMDVNIFEGMRTLAANIAVEVPEAEVDSSHYRILFLAAFVLFAFTFVVNTMAEIIRQRLRVRYGSL